MFTYYMIYNIKMLLREVFILSHTNVSGCPVIVSFQVSAQ